MALGKFGFGRESCHGTLFVACGVLMNSILWRARAMAVRVHGRIEGGRLWWNYMVCYLILENIKDHIYLTLSIFAEEKCL